jgi:hypothetical protein
MAREQVTDYDRPRYFAYHTSDYTFSLKYLATGAKGQWWFEEKDGQTDIRWASTFTGRGAVTAALLTLFVRSQWTGYMKVCLENTRHHFDPRSLSERDGGKSLTPSHRGQITGIIAFSA